MHYYRNIVDTAAITMEGSQGLTPTEVQMMTILMLKAEGMRYRHEEAVSVMFKVNYINLFLTFQAQHEQPSILFTSNLLDNLSNWLDRLFEGSTHRYHISGDWPEFPLK